MIVYILPNNKETKKLLQQQIIRKIKESERKNIRVIVIGDFNDIRSRVLDQNSIESKRTRTLPIIAWLESSSYEDVFRKIHPYKKEYTWSNGSSSSRIDYIWASRELSQGIIKCKISDAEYITNSDHKIVSAQFITGFSLKNRSLACSKRLKGKKRVLKIDKVTEEDWKAYSLKLEAMLKKKISKNNEEARLLESYKEKNIDELWDTISGCILKSAYKTLPSKKVKIDSVAPRRTGKSSVILKDLKTIGSLCHLCTEKEGLHIEEKDRYK